MIREISFLSWDHFRSNFQEHLEPMGFSCNSSPSLHRYVFRGIGDSDWNLETTFFRVFRRHLEVAQQEGNDVPSELSKIEKNLLKIFSTELSLLENNKEFRHLYDGVLDNSTDVDVATNMELWALGQHFGLPTNLLDWTYSPYIAAWFAFSSVFHKSVYMEYADVHTNTDRVAIWAILYPGKSDNLHDNAIHELWNSLGVTFFEGRDAINPRVRAQRGLFTKVPCNKTCFDNLLEGNELVVSQGESYPPLALKFTLPQHCMVEAFHDLEYMDITPRKLFTDVRGACESASIEMQISLYNLYLENS